MHTCGGISAMKRIVRPRSSSWSMRAFSSALGSTGRFFRIGVATSPGQSAVARRPWMHSSMLNEWLSAIIPALLAVYAGPVR